MDVRKFLGKAKKSTVRRKGRITVKASQLNARIKRVVKGMAEKKMAYQSIEIDSHNSSITNADCYQIVPAIAPGDGSNQRQGDTVRPTMLLVKAMVSIDQSEFGTGPRTIQCRLLALKQYTQANADDAQIKSSTDTDHLLNGGGTNNTNYDGSQEHHLMPVNKDLMRVFLDKRFTLTTGTSDNTKSSKMISFKIPVPKVLKFTPSGGNLPTNLPPFLALGYCYPNGESPDTVTTAVHITASSFLYYTDE